MKNTTNTLRFYMDETSAPYSDAENPFVRTKEDDDFDKAIIEKYHLETRDNDYSERDE